MGLSISVVVVLYLQDVEEEVKMVKEVKVEENVARRVITSYSNQLPRLVEYREHRGNNQSSRRILINLGSHLGALRVLDW